jgi:Ca2+-binding RTX toxin-like protein
VVAFVIGCTVLLLGVGCAGTRSEAPKEGQGHTEAANKDQTRSPQATASEEEARCQGTRTFKKSDAGGGIYITNDLPGCPKGGLLKGTDKADSSYAGPKEPARPGLSGEDGDDEIRGLGGSDEIFHGSGDDVIYAGPGNDDVYPDTGKDVIYGGDGNDMLASNDTDGQRDKLYCGAGRDKYLADPTDYVDSSCDNASAPRRGGGA